MNGDSKVPLTCRRLSMIVGDLEDRGVAYTRSVPQSSCKPLNHCPYGHESGQHPSISLPYCGLLCTGYSDLNQFLEYAVPWHTGHGWPGRPRRCMPSATRTRKVPATTRASQAGKGAMVDLALKKPNHHQSHQSQVHSCRLYLRRGTAEACPRNSDPKGRL